jgi:DNA-directed RNA polymerase specialized sigma24 family protein
MRLAIDERRRRRRWGFLPIRETDQMWAMTIDPDLWRALADLDRRTRVSLVLTVLDGYTQDEVGELLGVPRGTRSLADERHSGAFSRTSVFRRV